MKVGLIVRSDDRGLGNQCWEVQRHLPHDRVLVVRDPGSERQGFVSHVDRFPGATVVEFGRYGDGFDPKPIKAWLKGLDVVYSAETYYDWRMVKWARALGVATVLHANPEFYFHWAHPAPEPSTWWSATPWRLEHMPEGTRVVPMPIPVDRWEKPDFEDCPRRVLHMAGLGAIRDRNGTLVVRKAHALLRRAGIELVMSSQGPVKEFVDVETRERHSDAEYWKMYEGFPMTLIPRRYGGLCLPAIEALGAGSVLAMTECSPNEVWPHIPLDCVPERKPLECQGGMVQLHEVDFRKMADLIISAFDNGDVPELRRESWEWAQQNSWDALVPFWERELARAVAEFRG